MIFCKIRFDIKNVLSHVKSEKFIPALVCTVLSTPKTTGRNTMFRAAVLSGFDTFGKLS